MPYCPVAICDLLLKLGSCRGHIALAYALFFCEDDKNALPENCLLHML